MQSTETKAMRRTRQGEISWVDLVAKDLDAQTAFYEGLFGWTHRDTPTDAGPIYRTFTSGDAMVAGASQMSPEMMSTGMPPVWNTYIIADDVDAMARRATGMGATVVMPAMDVMDQGRMVGIQDPTGGTVFFWQVGEHAGADLYNAHGALVWADLDTREPEKAAAFFKDLLGWEVGIAEESEAPYWIAGAYGRPQAGIMPMPEMVPAEAPAHWMVYFGADDVRSTVETAKSLGAKVTSEPMEAGGMTFAILTDPMGAMFALMTPMTGM